MKSIFTCFHFSLLWMQLPLRQVISNILWLPCLCHLLLLHLHYPDARKGGFGPVNSLLSPHDSRVYYNKQVNYILLFLVKFWTQQVCTNKPNMNYIYCWKNTTQNKQAVCLCSQTNLPGVPDESRLLAAGPCPSAMLLSGKSLFSITRRPAAGLNQS